MPEASMKAAAAAAPRAPSAVEGVTREKKKKQGGATSPLGATSAAAAESAEKKVKSAAVAGGAGAAAASVSQKRRILRYTSVLSEEPGDTAARESTAARRGEGEGTTQQRVPRNRGYLHAEDSKKKQRKRKEFPAEKERAAVDSHALENVRELERLLFGKSSSGTESLQQILPQRQHRQQQIPQQLQGTLLKQQEKKKKAAQQQPQSAETSSTSGARTRRQAVAAAAAAEVSGAHAAAAGGSSPAGAARSKKAAAAAEKQQQQGDGGRKGLLRKQQQTETDPQQQQGQWGGVEGCGQRQQKFCDAETRTAGQLLPHKTEQQLLVHSEEEKEEVEQQQRQEQQGGPGLMRVAVGAGGKGSHSEAASTQRSKAAHAAAAAAADGEEAAAWVDPDDEMLQVDIAGEEKLRKLRRHEGETAVGGVEYAQRLKQLHAKLAASRSSGWIERARKRKQLHQQQQQQLLLGAPASLLQPTSGDEEEEAEETVTASTGQAWASISSSSAVLSAAAASKQQRSRSSMQLPPTAGSTSSGGMRAVGFVMEKEEALPVGKISVKRLVDANAKEYSGCAISAVDFHPQQPTLLTAGRDKTLRLFSIDGEENAKLEAIHFKNFPLLQAKFASADGSHILAVSHASPSLAHYDIITGEVHMLPPSAVQGGQKLSPCGFHFLEIDRGAAGKRINSFALASAASQNVLLCDARSKRLLRVLAMNGKAAGMAYHPTKESIFTADREANIYEWDLRAEGCVSCFQDSSCLRLSALAASPPAAAVRTAPSSLLVTGSRTGFVDLFSLPSGAAAGEVNRKPVKELGNLTTEITTVAFHPSNQLLCIASKWKKDALRLVHLPSMTVFQNWPVERTPLRYVTAAAFSHQRGFMAIGNDRGRVLLYRLHHFGR